MRTYLLIIFSFLLMTSCGDSNSRVSQDFQEEYTLELEQMPNGRLEVGLPYDMVASGDCIYVLAYDGSNWLHCYEKSTGSLLWSDIKTGRGPGELAMCVDLQYDESSRKMYLFDKQQQAINIFVVDSEGKLEYQSRLTAPVDEGAQIYGIWRMQDNTWLANLQRGPLSSLNRYELLRSDGMTLSVCKEAPDLEGDDIYTYLQSMTAVSPDGCHFVSVTLFGQIIEFYSVKNSEIVSRIENVFAKPNIVFDRGTVRPTQNTIWGYPYVATDNNYVYSVLNGTYDVDSYDKIAIYSWRGEPVKLLKLNRNILRICVDDEFIYAIAVNSDGELVLSKVPLS